MLWYPLLKNIHITCVLLSISGFLLRAWWRFYAPHRLQAKLVKILPHMIDTLLLASAIGLSLILQQYPLVHHWLTAKVVLLLVYIFAGAITLKTRFDRQVSLFAFLIAVSSFATIVFTALSHRA